MSQQWRSISEEQLSRMAAQGAYSGIFVALERVRKIRKTGHRPAIFYDKLHGFLCWTRTIQNRPSGSPVSESHLKARTGAGLGHENPK